MQRTTLRRISQDVPGSPSSRLVKITFARVLASRWYLIASVGLTLMIALQVAFFTKSFPIIFGDS